MNTFIMIIIFATGSVDAPVTTTEASFNSFETCEIARKHIVDSLDIINKTYAKRWFILSQGCYRK